ncbi:FecR domain-containing protein [Acinetobacter sp. NIPH 2699]|uniref:FecR family protein n=1 Tax=Acinetobacter sp. NIPH 2699 TaxID=2923433 RepID=UPI001F4BCB24|nr:FecR domain-containing protein [Acinetobacter sp. NIPH 2699]MCH7337071.1 FecR domain-containing protein [Acinetobacter sp. NIPH 2699]
MNQASNQPSAYDLDLMEQVATWLLLLESETCTEQDRLDFIAWQKQDVRHVEMLQQMQGTFEQFQSLRQHHSTPIPHQIIEQTIQTVPIDRSLKKYGFYSFAFITMLMALLWFLLPTEKWLADSHNSYNVWSHQMLPDHSKISISGKTNFNIDFDEHHRVIKLMDGNILVDVAPDAKRIFYIKTKYANIKALGTRFIVHHSDRATLLTMLHSTTEVEAISMNGQRQVEHIHAGQQILIDDSGLHQIRSISADLFEDSWNKKKLVVDLMPLDQVLNILQSYEHKNLKYNPKQLDQILVSAILPLDEAGLDLLQLSLPIEVKENLFGQKVIEPEQK